MNRKPLRECKILVTPRSFAKYDKSLKDKLENSVKKVSYNDKGRPLKEEELIDIIGEFDGYIAGLDKITKKVIDNKKELKIIARYGTGVDRVDLEAAKSAGIYVTNTPGANSVSVAELTIGMAISASRNIVYANNQVRKGKWLRIEGISLVDKTFGIIGLGNVGKEVALRLKPFVCRVLAYDTKFDYEFSKKNNIDFLEIDNLLKESDFVSLHIPVCPQTVNMVDKSFLEKMKKGSFLINTARGELVDEIALYNSIKNGYLKGAALDAFRDEPCNPDNPLLKLSQVIVTSHIGAATDNASNKMTSISISECIAVLKGDKPSFAVVCPSS